MLMLSTKHDCQIMTKPCIMIHRFPLSWTTEELIGNISISNHSLFDFIEPREHIKPCFQLNKDAAIDSCSWVIKFSLALQRVISSSDDFLSLGWFSTKLRDFYNIKHCNNCRAYGHLSCDCRSQTYCPDCAAVGHTTKSCEYSEQEVKCITW